MWYARPPFRRLAWLEVGKVRELLEQTTALTFLCSFDLILILNTGPFLVDEQVPRNSNFGRGRAVSAKGGAPCILHAHLLELPGSCLLLDRQQFAFLSDR